MCVWGGGGVRVGCVGVCVCAVCVCVCVCVCVFSFPYSQALLPPSQGCLRTCAFINLTHLFLEIRGGKRGASETVWPAGALREHAQLLRVKNVSTTAHAQLLRVKNVSTTAHAQLLRVKNVSTTALWLLNSKPSPSYLGAGQPLNCRVTASLKPADSFFLLFFFELLHAGHSSDSMTKTRTRYVKAALHVQLAFV